MSAGTLFTEDFLAEGIIQSPDWQDLDARCRDRLRTRIADVFASVVDPASLNEAQTQHRIIEPVLSSSAGLTRWRCRPTLTGAGRANVRGLHVFRRFAARVRADATGPRRQAETRDRRRRREAMVYRPRPVGGGAGIGKLVRASDPLPQPGRDGFQPGGALGDSDQWALLAALFQRRAGRCSTGISKSTSPGSSA